LTSIGAGIHCTAKVVSEINGNRELLEVVSNGFNKSVFEQIWRTIEIATHALINISSVSDSNIAIAM
jgi:hypothetical protein